MTSILRGFGYLGGKTKMKCCRTIGLCFLLINWLSFGKGGGWFVRNWTSKVEGVEEVWT